MLFSTYKPNLCKLHCETLKKILIKFEIIFPASESSTLSIRQVGFVGDKNINIYDTYRN